MKKSSAKIRAEMARLKDQLIVAETREAERIGRIALKAGLGEIEVEDDELEAAFEELAKRFRDGNSNRTGNLGGAAGTTIPSTAPIASGAIARGAEEA